MSYNRIVNELTAAVRCSLTQIAFPCNTNEGDINAAISSVKSDYTDILDITLSSTDKNYKYYTIEYLS